ncbi:MAG: hypothetical protein QXJ59_07310, partial [Thermofilaceae archaeon]
MAYRSSRFDFSSRKISGGGRRVKASPKVLKIAQLIRDMRVRGAGRIARAAAYAMKVAALEYQGSSLDDYLTYMRHSA